jgi:hypothetical protein
MMMIILICGTICKDAGMYKLPYSLYNSLDSGLSD